MEGEKRWLSEDIASFPGPLFKRLLSTTFDPHDLGVQRSHINIACGGKPGDEAREDTE